ITSRGDRDHVIKAVQAGVSEYIGKPFTRENFVAKLTKLVWKHLKIRPSQGDAPANPRAAGAAGVLGATAVDGKPKGGDLGGASVLMGATAKPAPAAAPAADSTAALLNPAAAAKPAAKAGARARGLADVRFASGSRAKLVIKDINLQEMIGVFRREDALPALLEQAVLDIVDQDSGEVA